MDADDRYWTGRDGGLDVDKMAAQAYASEIVLQQILLPIINSHKATKGPKLEGRMNSALRALLAAETPPGRSVSLTDEKILFRVGQKFHRAWDRKNQNNLQIGKLCREALEELDGSFVSKDAEARKSTVDRLKQKFEDQLDFYCSVGSALVDYDFRSREATVARILELFRELGLVKGEN
ncbi:hypothetical protein [Bosea sp. FBZP-16]|uniref:hypothetical protein n=1 Tax=Bosea sp. FBZP-16 TaxID=2065382 RepID=UPI00131A332A|nr:hypothetical protein [Bosea sp. FBZP-16]